MQIDPTWAKGIDVSHFHPVKDWGAIPPDVVMLAAKATQGSDFIDPTLAAHRTGARARGFDLVAYYHVCEPGDGAEDAERCAGVVGPLAPNECIVADSERSALVDIGYLEAFYARLEALGLSKPFDHYYGSAGVYGLMGNPPWSRAARLGLWAPRYKSAGAPPKLPPPWSDYRIWQWTDGGQFGDPYSCPGVGPCDASVFKGPRPALQAWVAGA